jgi:hypothetical protein
MPASNLPLAKQAELRGMKGEVDGEGDVVAELGSGGVGAVVDGLDFGGLVSVEEDVVDVVATDCAILNSLDGGMVLRWNAQCGANH